MITQSALSLSSVTSEAVSSPSSSSLAAIGRGQQQRCLGDPVPRCSPSPAEAAHGWQSAARGSWRARRSRSATSPCVRSPWRRAGCRSARPQGCAPRRTARPCVSGNGCCRRSSATIGKPATERLARHLPGRSARHRRRGLSRGTALCLREALWSASARLRSAADFQTRDTACGAALTLACSRSALRLVTDGSTLMRMSARRARARRR